jgi:hypothetical protein
MSVVMGQATVPSNSTVQVFILPPGSVNTTMWQPLPMAAQVYIGTSVNVSTVSGLPLSATPLNVESYVSSRGTPVYATTGNATGTSFMYIISGGG